MYRSGHKQKDKIKFSYWKKRFGVDQDLYEKILTKQKYVCAICKKKESIRRGGNLIALAIDHCHKTGSVRGLLCRRCNLALGLANDDPDILTSAVKYLTKTKRR